MRSAWAACMPSSDSLTKSSTALISFFTPVSFHRAPGGGRWNGPAEAGASAGPTPAKDLVDPPPRPLARLLPLRVPGLPLVLRPLRLEGPVDLPVLAHLVQRGPVPGGPPGPVRRAKRGRLLH